MTMMTHTHTNPNPTPVAKAYLKDPAGHYSDGTAAPAPQNAPNYGVPTTDAELFAAVDNQPIGMSATNGATIAEAARFTRKTKKRGAPTMGASHVLTLAPFRVYRTLAELVGEDTITSPYVQLLDLVLPKSQRTHQNEDTARAYDAEFPPEQASLHYRSQAERILAALDEGEVDDYEWDTPAPDDPAYIDADPTYAQADLAYTEPTPADTSSIERATILNGCVSPHRGQETEDTPLAPSVLDGDLAAISARAHRDRQNTPLPLGGGAR